MLTAEKYYGGGATTLAASFTIPRLGTKLVRNSFTFGDSTWTLSEPINVSPGGPVYILDNSDNANAIEVRRSDATVLASVPANTIAYAFLLDAQANSGSGEWVIAGSGVASVGDQGASEFGFNYNTAPAPQGIGLDLGDAFDNGDGVEYEIDFNNAFLLAPPPI